MESLWLHRHHPSWSPLSSSAVSKVVVDDGNIPNVNTSLLYESRNCLNCDFTYAVITNHIPLSTYANLWQTLLLDWRKLERSNEPRTTTLHQFHSIPHQECIKYRRKTKTFNVRLKNWHGILFLGIRTNVSFQKIRVHHSKIASMLSECRRVMHSGINWNMLKYGSHINLFGLTGKQTS